MKRFTFRLETVLRHRELLENLREQAFLTAQGEVLAIEAIIAQLRDEFRRTASERPGTSPGEMLNPGALLNRERYLEALQATIHQEQWRLEAAKVKAEERRRELVEARQAHEAVKKLREKDLAAYTTAMLHTEQELLDEQATIRHIRALRESSLMDRNVSGSPLEQPEEERVA
jgi:flagellar export protein FliJ